MYACCCHAAAAAVDSGNTHLFYDDRCVTSSLSMDTIICSCTDINGYIAVLTPVDYYFGGTDYDAKHDLSTFLVNIPVFADDSDLS